MCISGKRFDGKCSCCIQVQLFGLCLHMSLSHLSHFVTPVIAVHASPHLLPLLLCAHNRWTCIYALYTYSSLCKPAAIMICILQTKVSVGNQGWLAAGWSDHADSAKCYGQDWLDCWAAFGCQQCLHVSVDHVHAHHPIPGEKTSLGEPF